MKGRILLLLLFITVSIFAQAQYAAPQGGGEYEIPKGVCVTEAQKAKIEEELKTNRAMLVEQGVLSDRANAKTTVPKLDWPIKQASGFNYYNVYGISNYVDLDANYPNQLLDYNCGSRTYDLASGYNHGGIDIFSWPFSINMMDDDQVEIVAAAAGVILAKHDGSFDKNCSFNNDQWNAVYIEHSDGSVAWYGHMKKNSLTTKSIGQSVAAGEFLGLVGSSGSSTGPHLHFELHDNMSNVVDPYNGTCNTSPSLWNNQKPYRESKINTLMTNSAVPIFTMCPNPDVINAQDTFNIGSNVILSVFYSDQLSGQQSTFSVLRPDNSVEHTWTHSASQAYNASWWYWTRQVAATGIAGVYTFKVSYEGNDYEHKFYMRDPNSIVGAEKNKLLVYPSPASDRVYITGGKVYHVEVYDVMGKQLTEENAFDRYLDVSTLPNGMYTLRISSDEGVQLSKVVIRR